MNTEMVYAQSGIDRARELTKRRDQTDTSLLNLLVGVRAAEATRDRSERSRDGTLREREQEGHLESAKALAATRQEAKNTRDN